MSESIEDLKLELAKEKRTNACLSDEINSLKKHAVNLSVQIEEEEEMISNRLMKRLNDVKKEKEALAIEVEREEEFLTNTLQKKMMKLQKEKIDLENELEAEQEYIVNKLQKQLNVLNAERDEITKLLESDTNDLRNCISFTMNEILSKTSSCDNDLRQLISTMQVDVDKLSLANAGLKSNNLHALQEIDSLKEENRKLKDVNFLLQQQAMHEHEQLEHEKELLSQMELDMEIDSEHAFNDHTIHVKSNSDFIKDAMDSLRKESLRSSSESSILASSRSESPCSFQRSNTKSPCLMNNRIVRARTPSKLSVCSSPHLGAVTPEIIIGSSTSPFTLTGGSSSSSSSKIRRMLSTGSSDVSITNISSDNQL